MLRMEIIELAILMQLVEGATIQGKDAVIIGNILTKIATEHQKMTEKVLKDGKK